MALIFTVLFCAGLVAALLGVFVERGIVMGRLSSLRNEKVPLAFTQKARYQLLEDYKNEYGSGSEDIWYKYLITAYTHGMKYVWFMLVIAVLVFVI